MFLITGITGATGSAAAELLLAKGKQVRALVRDRARAETWAKRGVKLVEGDLLEEGAVAAAMKDVKASYLVVPRKLDAEDVRAYYLAIGEAVGRAAASAGLPRLVFLSAEGAHLNLEDARLLGVIGKVEKNLRRHSSTQITAVRASYFLDNWLPFASYAREQGVLLSLLDPTDRPIPMVAARDVGAACAELLLDRQAPPLVELQGPKHYAPDGIAADMGAALGRQLKAVAIPAGDRFGAARQAGFGPDYAELMAEGMQAFSDGIIRPSGEGLQLRGSTTASQLFEDLLNPSGTPERNIR